MSTLRDRFPVVMTTNSDKAVENHELLLELCPHLPKELLEAVLPADTPEVTSPMGTGGGTDK